MAGFQLLARSPNLSPCQFSHCTVYVNIHYECSWAPSPGTLCRCSKMKPSYCKVNPHSTLQIIFYENSCAQVVLEEVTARNLLSHCYSWPDTNAISKQLHSMFLGNAPCAATAGGHHMFACLSYCALELYITFI